MTLVERIGTTRLVIASVLFVLLMFFILSNLKSVEVYIFPFVKTDLPLCLAIIYSAMLGSLITLAMVYIRPLLAKSKQKGNPRQEDKPQA